MRRGAESMYESPGEANARPVTGIARRTQAPYRMSRGYVAGDEDRGVAGNQSPWAVVAGRLADAGVHFRDCDGW